MVMQQQGRMGITLFLNADRYSLEDARIELFYSIQIADGSWETIPMGIYEVSEANRNIKTISDYRYCSYFGQYLYFFCLFWNLLKKSTSKTPLSIGKGKTSTT